MTLKPDSWALSVIQPGNGSGHSTAPKAHIGQPTIGSMSSTTVQYTITGTNYCSDWVDSAKQPLYKHDDSTTNIISILLFLGETSTKPASVNGASS